MLTCSSSDEGLLTPCTGLEDALPTLLVPAAVPAVVAVVGLRSPPAAEDAVLVAAAPPARFVVATAIGFRAGAGPPGTVSPLEDVGTPEEAAVAVRLATGAAVGGAILEEGGCLPDVPEEEDIVEVGSGRGGDEGGGSEL